MSESYTIGLDVGGTKSLGLLVDRHGEVLAESRVPTPQGSQELLDTIADVVDELRALSGRIDGVGAGMPGLVTPDGRLRYAPNLVDADELDVVGGLRHRIPEPILVDNDANCAVWAEHTAGVAVGHDDVLLITLGTGIGTGLVVDGRLPRGANGFAGELGHIIIDPGGLRCGCGRHGCFETVASASGLVELARRTIAEGKARSLLGSVGGDAQMLKGEHITRAARQGDADALEILEEYGRWVALGLANYATILDPELVVVAGGLLVEGDLVLAPIRRHFGQLVMAADHRPPIEVVPAALGERAGALGAALLARPG